MNENHHQDKAMRDEIERVLNNQKSDDKLLSLLVSTKPIASTSFQTNLEDKLIEQLTVKNKHSGDTIMTEFNDKPKHKKKPSRLPFTLVAALIAIVLVGGLILFTTSNRGTPYDSYEIPAEFALTATQIINDATATDIAQDSGQSFVPTNTPSITPDSFMLTATAIIEDATATAMENNNQQVQATTTITPTATPITNENLQDTPDDFGRFLIALRDIELNEVITDEMVTTVQYDFEDTNWFMDEDNPGAIYFNTETAVIGQRASTFIHYHQPIHSNNVTVAENCEISVLACTTLDEGSVLMELSVRDRSALALPLGTQVDIIAALQYIDIGDESQAIIGINNLPSDIVPTITMETIISNATLLDIDSTGDNVLVTIALAPQDAILLQHMQEADVPLRFTPHIEQAEQTNQALQLLPEYPRTEDGLAVVAIPLEQINNDDVINVGDRLNIQFSISDVEQIIDITAQPEIEPESGDVIVFDRGIATNYLEIYNTEVLYIERGTSEHPNATDNNLFMTITINPDDAWIVNWYVNNGAEFTLNP